MDSESAPKKEKNYRSRMKPARANVIKEIETLLEDKMPVQAICRKLNVSRKTVYNWRDSGLLRKELFPTSSYPSYTGLHPDLPAWLDLHYAGFSYRKIAEGYSLSPQRIHQLVTRYKMKAGLTE